MCRDQNYLTQASSKDIFRQAATLQSARVSYIIYKDISASGTGLSAGLTAERLLSRRWIAVMEK